MVEQDKDNQVLEQEILLRLVLLKEIVAVSQYPKNVELEVVEQVQLVHVLLEVPDPFHPSLEWEDFKCPMCRLRPFLGKEWITLIDDRGNQTRIKVGEKPEETENSFKCSCGKTYKHQSSLARHKAVCNG